MVSSHPLAGRAIARMNGAGNKILVLDLRGAPVRPTPADARAIHRAPRLDYDQMMIIGDPRTEGTAADVANLQQRRHARRRLRQRDALRRRPALPRAWGRRRHDRTEGGVVACERLGPWSYRVDMGPPRLFWEDIPLAHAVADTRRVDLWPDDGGPAGLGPASAVNMGNPHAVFFVPDLGRVDVAKLGAGIEVHPISRKRPMSLSLK